MKLGPYQLSECIGEGGSGRVYAAVDSAGQPVAVKVLGPRARALDAAADARFAREIRTLASLAHPNVLALLDHGVDPEHGLYMVTPRVAGETLRALAARARLCPEAALALLCPLLAGLGAIHRAGLVHRDLKPDNVMVTPKGEVVIVDVGLAWCEAQTRHTAAGAVAGTAVYMSPEQIEGRALSPACDVFAVGVLVYELVAGRRPFERARQSEEVAAILAGSHAPLDEVDRRCSEGFAKLVGACLHPDPATRPADALELLARAQALLDWVEPAALADEAAAVVIDPQAYQDSIAGVRARGLTTQAREALRAGDTFAALRLLDRALAYAPRDPLALRLIESVAEAPHGSATSSSAERAPRGDLLAPDSAPSPRPATDTASGASSSATGGVQGAISSTTSAKPARGRSKAILALSVGAAWLLTAGAFALTRGQGATAPASTRRAAGVTAPRGARAERTGEALASAAADAGERSAPGAPPAASSAGAEVPSALRPIDPESLSNNDPPRSSSQIARPGEPLMPAAMFEGGSAEAALAQLERELRERPGEPGLRVGRAVAVVGTGRSAEGLAELAQLAREHPEAREVWQALGYLAIRRGALVEADEHFTRLLALRPRDAGGLRNRGIVRRLLGRTRDAYADLTAALAVAPDDVDAMAELTQIYDRAGRRADAVPLLRRIVRFRPDRGDAWADLSLAEREMDPHASVADARRAVALAPESRATRARLCNQLARTESPDAIAECTRALAVAPDDPALLSDRGAAYYAAGDDARALADMDRALALTPDDPQRRINRYVARMHAGMRAEALADLRAACDLGHDAACARLREQ